MAAYSLIASYSTVQVLSPTVVNDVVYCTIRTTPSGVIASLPIEQSFFAAHGTPEQLLSFAEAIEEIMASGHVIAGTGTQSIDANGLLADQVVFTVEYVPAGSTPTSITAEATVPVDDLRDPRATTSGGGIIAAQAIVDGVYADLQAAASG